MPEVKMLKPKDRATHALSMNFAIQQFIPENGEWLSVAMFASVIEAREWHDRLPDGSDYRLVDVSLIVGKVLRKKHAKGTVEFCR